MTTPTPTPPPASVADRLRRRSRLPWIVGGAAVVAAALVVGGISVWNAAAPVVVIEDDRVVVEEFAEAPEVGTWSLPLADLSVDEAGVCEAGQDAALLILHDQLGRPAALRILDTATGDAEWQVALPAGLDEVTCAIASIDRGAAIVSTVDDARVHGLLGVDLVDGELTTPSEPSEVLIGAGGPGGADGDVIVATATGVARLDLESLEPVWSVDAPGASVSAGPDLVVIGGRVVRWADGEDVGWAAADGAWAAVDGVLLRVDRDGAHATVHAVDPVSGSDRWSLQLEEGSAIPIHGSGLLLVADGSEGIVAIRLSDGGEAWRLDGTLAAEPVLLTGSGPAGIALLPITGAVDTVAVVDLVTGERRFDLAAGDPATPARLVSLTEQTITLALDGRIVAVESADGDVRWRVSPAAPGGDIIEVGGRLVQLSPGAVLGIGTGSR